MGSALSPSWTTAFPTPCFARSIEVGNDPTIWRVLKPIEDEAQEVQQMKDRFGVRKVLFTNSGFNVPTQGKSTAVRVLTKAIRFPSGLQDGEEAEGTFRCCSISQATRCTSQSAVMRQPMKAARRP